MSVYIIKKGLTFSLVEVLDQHLVRFSDKVLLNFEIFLQQDLKKRETSHLVNKHMIKAPEDKIRRIQIVSTA